MAGLLIMAALAGFGLEIHPGNAVRRAASESPVLGLSAGLRARLGEILTVVVLLGLVAAVALLLPESARRHWAVFSGTLFLAGSALLAAGWHRIVTTSRLDLRRGRLARRAGEERRLHARVLDGFFGEIRRPAWHAFWWALAPGMVLLALRVSVAALPLVVLVYVAVVLGWGLFLSSRLCRAREKLMGTAGFRSLHSLGGLALVAAAGLLFVESLGGSPLTSFTIEHVLRPLLGAG
jgi:hypothetical protein